MMILTGNALAYCLQALEEAMNYQIGWEGIKEENIQKIFNLIGWEEDGTNKTNVVNCALRIAVLLANNSRYGYTVLHPAIVKYGYYPFFPILFFFFSILFFHQFWEN